MRLLAAVLGLLAAATAHAADVRGSKDHPVLPRYAGSEITRYEQKAFDEAQLFAKGPMTGKPDNFLRAEGRVTRIVYADPKGRSTLEVFRNHQAALAQGKFTTLFACESAATCGDAGRLATARSTYGQSPLRYLLARRDDGVLVSLVVYPAGPDTTTEATIVEPKAMEQTITVVDASGIGRDVQASGRAVLYAIQFDTGKSTIRPESQPQIAELARYLARAKLPVLVVGHTDNAGELGFNQKLSQARAAAVVAALGQEPGVNRAALTPLGVGMAAPVATNANEAGRARNRRVEIVAR